ncbi:hypothetical protein MATL_G00026030 [Megalops atlanticus]|uniref:Uncharacterized protein n=1 Tax=Megalops atlanticus TaxID=7932 RepID=A0A9D3QHP2_MEGAT|nr:hypothetical protein MATL_G00026030 [Megalops atlanticus]
MCRDCGVLGLACVCQAYQRLFCVWSCAPLPTRPRLCSKTPPSCCSAAVCLLSIASELWGDRDEHCGNQRVTEPQRQGRCHVVIGSQSVTDDAAGRVKHRRWLEQLDRWKEFAAPPPLLFRKLSNPDLSPAAGKTKLHRQLSQDDSRARRSSMASGLTGKQLLPLSSSMHSGVSQLEPNNMVRMRNQSLGQSAPSLTAGLVSAA